MGDWYDRIEEPIRDLVRILRNNGFNTTCSCGHLPRPYIQMDWRNDHEIKHLYSILVENGYKNFEIRAHWLCNDLNRRFLEVIFTFPSRQVDISQIKN